MIFDKIIANCVDFIKFFIVLFLQTIKLLKKLTKKYQYNETYNSRRL